jgi:hypothetical protein
MNGQWIGPYSGTNEGILVADLDEADASYDGVVFAYESNTTLPRTCAAISIPKGKSVHSDRVRLDHVQRGSGLVLDHATITKMHPGVAIPTEADINYAIGQSGDISISWKTDIGTHGEGTLSKSRAQEASTLTPFRGISSWEDFVRHVRSLEPYRYAFRGHASNKWKLRTSFHRTGRSSLIKFMMQDVQSLHRQLSGLTSHHLIWRIN